MKLSQAGLDLIKSFEGYHTAQPDGSCVAYLDRLAEPPVWTIGYGLTEGVSAGMRLTADEAEAKLRAELAKHELIVLRCVTVDIGQSNFDALVSFNYNTGGLPNSTLLRKLNARDFDGAAREFDRWNKAGGKVYKGLVRRRAAERAMFEADARDVDIPAGAPDMPQAVDEPGMTAGQKAAVATAIPAVPATVTASVANAEGWQGMGQQIASMLSWAVSSKVAAASVLALAAIWAGPWIMSKVRG